MLHPKNEFWRGWEDSHPRGCARGRWDRTDDSGVFVLGGVSNLLVYPKMSTVDGARVGFPPTMVQGVRLAPACPRGVGPGGSPCTPQG